MAMLCESTTGELDVDVSDTTDMASVTAPSGLTLDKYITGLGDDPATTGEAEVETTCIKSGCKYAFFMDGTVTQTIPQ